MKHTTIFALGTVSLLALVGCSSDSGGGSGELSVILEAEDTIAGGLEAGDEVENIKDGWQARYEKFVVTVGDIDVHLATDEAVEAEDDRLFVVDLKSVPASGLPLWNLSGLRAGRWEFNYATSGAAHDASRHASVAASDFDRMVTADATYLISGTLSKAGGVSCPPPSLARPGASRSTKSNAAGHACYDNPSVRFEFLASAETQFGPCELDGVPGFSIAEGSTQTVAATIHGDHIFFNGFPEGDEGGVVRLAQWLADCDLNLDGNVTRAELEAIAPSALGEIDARYQLGGAPITPLTNMWTYVTGQLKTQGHMNGEGECPFDGMAHDH